MILSEIDLSEVPVFLFLFFGVPAHIEIFIQRDLLRYVIFCLCSQSITMFVWELIYVKLRSGVVTILV